MTIDLVARRQKLSEDIEKVKGDIRGMQAGLAETQAHIQQAMQLLDRMTGGYLMLEEILQAPGEPPPAGKGDDA